MLLGSFTTVVRFHKVAKTAVDIEVNLHLQQLRQEKDLIAILVAASYNYKPHRRHFLNELFPLGS